MLPAFFALVKPVSSIAKPACIKNIKAVQRRTHTVSRDEYIIALPFSYYFLFCDMNVCITEVIPEHRAWVICELVAYCVNIR